MNYLIDTHVFLWFIDDDKRLSQKASSIISNLENDIFFSKASLWEIVIKSSSGKLVLKNSLREIEDLIFKHKFSLVDFDFSHLEVLHSLEFIHRDPFDRMIVAQAISEKFILITDDDQMKDYPVQLIM